jgi:hypothetical protein
VCVHRPLVCSGILCVCVCICVYVYVYVCVCNNDVEKR